jgi:hypothetical protein
MSQKYLLVLERSSSELDIKTEGDNYVLEGIFTEIGVKNKNNRIYDEKEVLPHIDELLQKVKGSKLLGELDHPKSFEVSLKNASHVIESLEYDNNTKKVMGRIRLLNTSAGKEAKALVDAGIPLHISSRAAGVVESNGHVKIKKMFTYDLVADPGFANAELSRVNESFGFEMDDTLGIYEIPYDEKLIESFEKHELIDENTQTQNTNKSSKMNNTSETITIEDFNEYTKIVKNEIENLKKQISESAKPTEDETKESLVKYTETIAKRVNQIQENLSSLKENFDHLTSHNDYIIENLEKVKDYAEMVGEKSNQGINYSEKLAESVDHLIEYTKIVAEKADYGIQYTERVAESLDSSIEYQNHVTKEVNERFSYQSYINEQVDNLISHADYIVEGCDSIIKYSEYLKENQQSLTGYMDYVVKGINESNGLSKAPESAEGENKTEDTNNTIVNEGVENVNECVNADDFENEINSKVDSILEAAKAQKAEEKKSKLHFFTFLAESKRNEFDALNSETQEKIVNLFESTKWYGTTDATRIWESAFAKPVAKNDWLANMPSRYTESWNSLNESQKNAIKAQASVRVLESQYQIDTFWATRDLRVAKVETTEAPVAPINESSKYETPANYMDAVQEGLKRRFKKY